MLNVPSILSMLKELERRFPPVSGGHHGIHAAEYGSEEIGFTPKLALSLCLPTGFRTYFLDEGDTPEVIIDYISKNLSA